jgi:hypothetical protein
VPQATLLKTDFLIFGSLIRQEEQEDMRRTLEVLLLCFVIKTLAVDYYRLDVVPYCIPVNTGVITEPLFGNNITFTEDVTSPVFVNGQSLDLDQNDYWVPQSFS